MNTEISDWYKNLQAEGQTADKFWNYELSSAICCSKTNWQRRKCLSRPAADMFKLSEELGEQHKPAIRLVKFRDSPNRKSCVILLR